MCNSWSSQQELMPISLAEAALWVTLTHSMFWRQSLGIQKSWSFHFLSGNWATKWRSPDHPARETGPGRMRGHRRQSTCGKIKTPSQQMTTKNLLLFYRTNWIISTNTMGKTGMLSETGPNPWLTEQLGRKKGRKEGWKEEKKKERKKTNMCASKPLPFKQCFIIADF